MRGCVLEESQVPPSLQGGVGAPGGMPPGGHGGGGYGAPPYGAPPGYPGYGGGPRPGGGPGGGMGMGGGAEGGYLSNEMIHAKLVEREGSRVAKDYARSDAMRDE